MNGASLVAQLVKSLPVRQETQVQSLGLDDPMEKEMAIHSSIPALENPTDKDKHKQTKNWSLVGCSPWGHRVGHD